MCGFFFTITARFIFQIDILGPFEAHRIPGLPPCNVTPEKRRKEHTIEKNADQYNGKSCLSSRVF